MNWAVIDILVNDYSHRENNLWESSLTTVKYYTSDKRYKILSMSIIEVSSYFTLSWFIIEIDIVDNQLNLDWIYQDSDFLVPKPAMCNFSDFCCVSR